jgi:hypothetical protein
MAAVAACTVSVAGLLEAVNTVLASGATDAQVKVDGNANKVTLTATAARQWPVSVSVDSTTSNTTGTRSVRLAHLKAALASIPSGVTTAALAFFDAAAPAPALWTLTYGSNPQRIATVTNVAR